MPEFQLAFSTPRKLPRARDLTGRVAVLDIAFASEAGGGGFTKTTLPFIESLGPRLRAWVDHHDSEHHARFEGDPRFVLATKIEHPACPEMITAALIERVGPVETLVCHGDFDGLASAAKWMRGGVEPYPGCDLDARAIDTRMGLAGPVGQRFDRALRARARDSALFGLVVRHLAAGLEDPSLWGPIDAAGAEVEPLEAEARRLADAFTVVHPGVALVDASARRGPYDKTHLLLLGQARAQVSVVVDRDSATFAAPFDSGVDFLRVFGLSGGMPTVVSVPRSRVAEGLAALGVRPADVARLTPPAA
jgi:hypothetical protein